MIFDTPLHSLPPSLGSRSTWDNSCIDGRGRQDPVTGVWRKPIPGIVEAERLDYYVGDCAVGTDSSTDANSKQNPNPSSHDVR
ncbi:hypothetical protein ACFX2I_018864 [Malus domestica]